MKQTAREQQRQMMSRSVLPPDWHDLAWVIGDFCKQPVPDSTSEMANRTLQLNTIIDKIGDSR